MGRCRHAPGLAGPAHPRSTGLSLAQASRRERSRVTREARTDGGVSPADGARLMGLACHPETGPSVPAPAGPAAPRQPRPDRTPYRGGGARRVCPRSTGPRLDRGARGRADRCGPPLSPAGLRRTRSRLLVVCSPLSTKKREGHSGPLNVGLQVLGCAEPPHIDQRVGHQFHPLVSTLKVLKTQQQPLEFVLPCERPLDALP